MEWIKVLVDYVKKLLSNKGNKKVIENSVIAIIIGVIILIAAGSFFGGNKQKSEKQYTPDKNDVEVVSNNITSEDKADIEKKIAAILSQIEGAGKVSVMITYVSGKEIVPAYDTKKNDNETAEKDTGGGTRNIRQGDYESKVAYEEGQGGGKKPIVLKELQPAVKGVVVVAEGASDPVVKENLCRAVQVLVDVPVHRIQVFEKNK